MELGKTQDKLLEPRIAESLPPEQSVPARDKKGSGRSRQSRLPRPKWYEWSNYPHQQLASQSVAITRLGKGKRKQCSTEKQRLAKSRAILLPCFPSIAWCTVPETLLMSIFVYSLSIETFLKGAFSLFFAYIRRYGVE
jgi:hypothetical protein